MTESSSLDEKGQLIEELRPAVYLDTTVVIEYWIVEGLESDRKGATFKPLELPYHQTIRELLAKSQKDMEALVEIRKEAVMGQPKLTLVTSALALFELCEWHAEAAIRQMASEVVGAKLMAKKGKKEIGGILKSAIKKQVQETKKDMEEGYTSGIEMVMMETWVNPSFADAHGLRGLLVADITGFELTDVDAWGPCEGLAYLQIGGADMMHVLFAQHLGCEYFASTDSDFKRVEEILFDEFDLKLLSSRRGLLEALK